MTPNDQTVTQGAGAPPADSEVALDAGLAAAFASPSTHSYHPAEPEAGTLLAGKYRLAERIGEGGMGSVWVAHQSEPVKRKVAVKLIKAGMDSKSVLARFEAERQALAVMDHPNIAKVLDGGLHEGRPFFVMELVKGVPITEYCDARKLTPKERLELFVPVCQAIQHAHQKGVIHRDIKPSNVLVALYDDKPVPKVIDFGIAKATGGVLTEQTIETAFGGVVGTPQYMSPEQASLNNLDIDTRSDVYSLGVLLYELLTGSPPFARKELEKRGLLEILRVVREEEPQRPSLKLSTADALPSLSASRSTEPKKLTGLLRNELDWIVMKALEKDRARRYETANGFAADVNRYLSGDAVRAHPPSTTYRLRKFVRRNRVQVIAASLVLFALLAGIGGTTVGLIRANRAVEAERVAKKDAEEQKGKALLSAEREADERKKADAAKVEAEAKEAEANAVVKFFGETVFTAGRPKGEAGGLGHDVTLRDAVRASLPVVAKSFAAQPLVEARLRATLGQTFLELGDYTQATEQYEQARVLFTHHLGTDHPLTLSCMSDLALSYFRLNRVGDATKLCEATLTVQKRVLPPDHPDTLKSMNNLAGCYYEMNRLDEAVKLYEATLTAEKRVLPPNHPNIISALNNLANTYWRLNRRAEALELQKDVLSGMLRVGDPERPTILRYQFNLANSYFNLNRHAEAAKLYEETLVLQKRILPPDRPDTLKTINNLAGCYIALNRPVEALALIDEFLAKANRPGVHPRSISVALALRVQHFQHVGDIAGCRATAEMLEKLNPTDMLSWYNAACCRAMTAGLQAKAKDPDAVRLAKEDADKAMTWLTKAVAAGWTDVVQLKQDTDLDPLRDREDFKKLLAELVAKFPLKKEALPAPRTDK